MAEATRGRKDTPGSSAKKRYKQATRLDQSSIDTVIATDRRGSNDSQIDNDAERRHLTQRLKSW